MVVSWNGEITVDGQCKVSMFGSTASELIAKLLTDSIYYQAIYPASKVVMAGIICKCSACQGRGKVSKAMANGRWKEITCPNCKGKHVSESMADIPFNMPDSANRITLHAA